MLGMRISIDYDVSLKLEAQYSGLPYKKDGEANKVER
jgi:hypothetical protein